MAEEWRTFRDGSYEVSSLGNVRRNRPGISTFVGRPVRPCMGAAGYQQVQLAMRDENKRLYVHRVVAEAFIGPCPPGHVVNHKDANRQNNALSNLEYVTKKENTAHALRVVGRSRGPRMTPKPLVGKPIGERHWTRRMPERIARGERMGGSKLTESDVVRIKERVASGEMQRVMAAELGVSKAQVSRIVRGTRWAHVGGKRG